MGSGASHSSSRGTTREVTEFTANDRFKDWVFFTGSGQHKISLVHNILSGRRVISIDGKQVEVVNHNFFDSGSKHAHDVGTTRCVVVISVCDTGFFTYDLHINGTPFDQYQRKWTRNSPAWTFELGSEQHTVIIPYQDNDDKLDAEITILLDGMPVNAVADFCDGGSSHAFIVGPSDVGHAVLIAKPQNSNKQQSARAAALCVGEAIAGPPSSECDAKAEIGHSRKDTKQFHITQGMYDYELFLDGRLVPIRNSN